MTSTSITLTKILNVPGIGSKTAQKIWELAKDLSIQSDEDFISHILQVKSNFRLSHLTEIQVRDAFHKAERIIEESVRNGVKSISIYDSDYPVRLKNFKTNPPTILHYKGNLDSFQENPSCAVIGTREPTGNGYKVGIRVGELLGQNKVTVISGLARGCDTAGHIGCLKQNGKTIAVLAHGLKHMYPKENKRLADAIVEKGGALITEYAYDLNARSNFFVERDRIQAGLSDNVFVVETGVKGGTMHTVKYAIDNFRKVFTYAHPDKERGEEKAKGNQKLISESKATPVGNARDFESFLVYLFKSTSHTTNFADWTAIHLANDANIISQGSFLISTEVMKADSKLDSDFELQFEMPLEKKKKPKKEKKPGETVKRKSKKKGGPDDSKPDAPPQINLWE